MQSMRLILNFDYSFGIHIHTTKYSTIKWMSASLFVVTIRFIIEFIEEEKNKPNDALTLLTLICIKFMSLNWIEYWIAYVNSNIINHSSWLNRNRNSYHTRQLPIKKFSFPLPVTNKHYHLWQHWDI